MNGNKVIVKVGEIVGARASSKMTTQRR